MVSVKTSSIWVAQFPKQADPFSLGHASTEADVDAAATAVAQALEVLTPQGLPR